MEQSVAVQMDLDEGRTGSAVAAAIRKRRASSDRPDEFLGNLVIVRDVTHEKELERMKDDFLLVRAFVVSSSSSYELSIFASSSSTLTCTNERFFAAAPDVGGLRICLILATNPARSRVLTWLPRVWTRLASVQVAGVSQAAPMRSSNDHRRPVGHQHRALSVAGASVMVSGKLAASAREPHGRTRPYDQISTPGAARSKPRARIVGSAERLARQKVSRVSAVAAMQCPPRLAAHIPEGSKHGYRNREMVQ